MNMLPSPSDRERAIARACGFGPADRVIQSHMAPPIITPRLAEVLAMLDAKIAEGEGR